MTIGFCQSVSYSPWKGNSGDSSSVLMVPTTLGSECSFRAVFSSASVLTVVAISSLRCPRTLCFSKRCCFVVVLVTRKMYEQLGRALILSFAENSLGWRGYGQGQSKEALRLIYNHHFWYKEHSSNFCLATRTVIDCFMVDCWSSFVLNRVLIFAFCVICFVNTASSDESSFSKERL